MLQSWPPLPVGAEVHPPLGPLISLCPSQALPPQGGHQDQPPAPYPPTCPPYLTSSLSLVATQSPQSPQVPLPFSCGHSLSVPAPVWELGGNQDYVTPGGSCGGKSAHPLLRSIIILFPDGFFCLHQGSVTSRCDVLCDIPMHRGCDSQRPFA